MRLIMRANNGNSWCMLENATHLDLRNLVRRRERQGYQVEFLSPMDVEVSDENAMMENDHMGIASLVADDHRIYEAGE